MRFTAPTQLLITAPLTFITYPLTFITVFTFPLTFITFSLTFIIGHHTAHASVCVCVCVWCVHMCTLACNHVFACACL